MTAPAPARIPLNSLVLGYGPMLPFVAAALGAWILPQPWPGIATTLAILWGALILAFLAGVRRGYGFGDPRASTAHAIAAMLAYFVPAGGALILAAMDLGVPALLLLAFGFCLVGVLDRRAARSGDVPEHFAQLRPPQMSIAVLSLAALLARVML